MVEVQRWSNKDISSLQREVHLLVDAVSLMLHGQDEMIQTIKEVVPGLIGERPQNHGDYEVFVASGHVRAGKTRIGEEIGKVVKCMSNGRAIYILVDLGNGNDHPDCVTNPLFFKGH
jgi:hypothetical protein